MKLDIAQNGDHTAETSVSMTYGEMIDAIDRIAIECGRQRIEADDLIHRGNALKRNALEVIDAVNALRRQVEAGTLAIESVTGALGGVKATFDAHEFAGRLHEGRLAS